MGCSNSKYLQQCQIDGAESLGKGMNVLGNKLPDAYARVNKYQYENSMMSNLIVIGNESNYIKVAKKIDTLSEVLAQKEAQYQQALDGPRAGWVLCLKIAELLKAISNPEYAKVFDANKDGLKSGVDSLVSKYNFTASNKIKADYGILFSQIALQIGKHKIKKSQKEYFKKGIDSSGQIMFTILDALRRIQLKNYRQNIESVRNDYFDTYIALNSIASENKMKPELAQKMLTELEKIKKELIYLEMMGNKLDNFSDNLQKLIAALTDSVNGKIDCKLINQIITDTDIIINQLDINSSFLK